MNNIHSGDLAVVVQGLWPNVGRLVYVTKFVRDFDFSTMGSGIREGWRVRSWSQGPLETTGGPRMVGFTPVGSLRRLDPLPPLQQRELRVEMARLDFDEALCELATILKKQEELEKQGELLEV
jgi:hypothetical protein